MPGRIATALEPVTPPPSAMGAKLGPYAVDIFPRRTIDGGEHRAIVVHVKDEYRVSVGPSEFPRTLDLD